MKHAAKLNLDVPMPFLNRAKLVLGQHVIKKHGYGLSEDDKPRVVRRYLPRKQTELVRAALPDSIKDALVAVNLTEIKLLPPHVHTIEEAIINFYLDVGGEKTAFYEGDVVVDDTNVADNGNGYFNLRKDVLNEVESFVAQPNDVWLINTKTPHSVGYAYGSKIDDANFEPLNDKKRLIMQAFLHAPYSQVAEALKHKML